MDIVWVLCIVIVASWAYGFMIGYATVASKLDAERVDKANTGICNPIVLGIRCDGCKYEKYCCEKEVK